MFITIILCRVDLKGLLNIEFALMETCKNEDLGQNDYDTKRDRNL